MEDPCKDLDHLVGGIVVHEDARIKSSEIRLVKCGLIFARPVCNIEETRIQTWFFDSPVSEGIHLFVWLEVRDFLDLTQGRGIARIGLHDRRADIGYYFFASRVVVTFIWLLLLVARGVDLMLWDTCLLAPRALDFQER